MIENKDGSMVLKDFKGYFTSSTTNVNGNFGTTTYSFTISCYDTKWDQKEI